MEKAVYTKLTVESANGGWIVKEGKDTTIFYQWERLVNYLKDKLTS